VKLTGAPRHVGEAAADSGSLAETVVAIVVLGMSAAMVITFYVAASNVERRERLRSEALALIEVASDAARSIDCVQNAYNPPRGLEVCGPPPGTADGTDRDINGVLVQQAGKVVKPAALTDPTILPSRPAWMPPGEETSGHGLITLEWADYYLLSDMGSCSAPVEPPRAAREVTATWSDGVGIRTITRTAMGPSVPLTRGWTAIPAITPERDTHFYLLASGADDEIQVPSYEGCKVLVSRVGDASRTVGAGTCVLKEGWNALTGCI
jgi:type II secretory pathway pseudopilin PulG